MIVLGEIHIVNHHHQICESQTTEKMSPTKKTHGKVAAISCLINFIHPSQLIRNKYLSPASVQRFEGCITVHQEVKWITRKDQLGIVIHHDNYNEVDGETLQELYNNLADTQAKLVNMVDTARDDINLQLFECLG